MPDQTFAQSLEEEIQALEEKLARKKRELAPKEEKELFREVLREHIAEAQEVVEKRSAEGPPAPAPSTPVPSVPATTPYDYASKVSNTASGLQEKEHKEQVTALIEIAFTKGILEAVEVARHIGNPHLLDDFHDSLVDDYYEKLVQARKISTP